MQLGESWIYEYEVEELRSMWRSELRILRNKLEKSSLEQAALFDRWYQACEDAEDDLAEAKLIEGRRRSKAELKIRRIHVDYKEGAIKAKVNMDKSVMKAERKVREYSRYVRALKGAVRAFETRKSMIQTLKDLYQSNYWNKTTKGGTPVHGRRKQR